MTNMSQMGCALSTQRACRDEAWSNGVWSSPERSGCVWLACPLRLRFQADDAAEHSFKGKGDRVMNNTMKARWWSELMVQAGCIVLLGSLGVACGDADEEGETASIETLEDFNRELARILCGMPDRCPLDSFTKSIVMQARATDDCPAVVFNDEAFVLESISVAEGKAAFDPQSAEACLEQARTTCGLSETPACEQALVGLVEEGQLCREDYECVPGLKCSETGDDVCAQVCEPLSEIGESCNASIDCAQGASLDERAHCSEEGLCEPQTVVLDAVEGEPCGDLDEGTRRVFCQEGLLCTASFLSAEGTCKTAIPVGDACEDLDPCQGDGLCIGDVCLEVAIRLEGESCDDAPVEGRAAQFCNEFIGLICTDGTCQPMPGGGEGEPCREGGFNGSCDDGLYCDFDAQVCLPLKVEGESCRLDRECASDVCDSEDDVCIAPLVCE